MIDHLSYSSISSYLACAANWKMHYLDKLPTTSSPELAFGSAFHNTIEQFIDAGHQGDIVETWRANWSAQVEKETGISWDGDSSESMCNLGIRMLNSPEIVKGILSIKSDQIETKVELMVPGVPIPIIGYIDVITADGRPGDFKTSKASWTMDKALNETQPLFYLAAMNQAGIKHDWIFRHFVFVKTKEPKFQMFEHSHNPAQVFWLFKMIRNVWRGIEAGVFPENAGSWKCNPNYCDYWSLCRGKS